MREYIFTVNGTVCGAVKANTKRRAMEHWAAEDLYERDVEYGRDTVTVNGVMYRCEEA